MSENHLENSYPRGVDLFQKRAILVQHMTSKPDDPLLANPFPHATCREERGICCLIVTYPVFSYRC
jgi:hypothetical protein